MVDKKTGIKPKAKSLKPKADTKKRGETGVKSKELRGTIKKAPIKTKKPIADKLMKGAPEAKKPKVLITKLDTTAKLPEQKTLDSNLLTLDSADEVRLAKAGRRSAKAIKETEEEKAKEARKAAIKEAEAKGEKPKIPVKPPRSRAERAGKKYRQAIKLIDKSKAYALDEALDLAVKTSPVKFDATVELHINLNVDPKQADQNVRGSIVLPAGTGKNIKVAVFVDVPGEAEAKAAGADIVGTQAVTALLDKEQLDFDVLIAPPALMAQLGKYAKILGPRGLMPNPKSGSVTNDTAKAVKEAKAGRVEFRLDPSGIIHLAIGKVSFGQPKLQENAETVLSSVRSAKPASIKGTYIKSIFLTTTMGPSIKVSPNK